MSLFRPIIADEEIAALRRELSWLSDLLGTARDFDVLQRETFEPPIHAGQAPMGATALLAEVARRRKHAHAALHDALHSDRMRKLLLDLAHWLDHGQWRTSGEIGTEDPVLERAPELLDKQFKRLRRHARHLRQADPEERHRIRIAAKKLRYISEFFDSLVTGAKHRRRYKKFVRSLEAMQASLGKIHDADARTEFLETLVTNMAGNETTSRAAITAYAAGVFTAGERPKEMKLIRKAVKAFAKLSRTRPFFRPA